MQAIDGCSLRDRQRRIKEQDESIKIEGLGAKEDRHSKLTEKDLAKAEEAALQYSKLPKATQKSLALGHQDRPSAYDQLDA